MIATAKMTGVEFDALPYEEGGKQELVEGELIEVGNPNAEHQEIVLNLAASLLHYFRNEQTGRAYLDIEFALGPNLRLCPDVSVLLGEKWRALNRRQNPQPMAPDLAIEVISPSERTLESTRKVRTYLKEGVSEVWQVFPETEEVLVHRSGPSITVLSGTGRLESSLLPGWYIELSELFPS